VSRPRPPSANAERDRLIESQLSLVHTLARRFVGRGEELDDLVQVGTVGLIKAADRFDARRGVSFRAFASLVIEGEIRRHLRDRTGSVRIPRELQRMSGELRRWREHLTASLGRSPTTQELAIALGADEHDVERALAAARARDYVEISTGETPIASGAGAEQASDDRVLVNSSMRLLGERERRIVFLRFHADLTEREIARTVGLSQAHVSRIITTALATLREHLGSAAGAPAAADITAAAAISPAANSGDSVQADAGNGSRLAGVGAAPEHRHRGSATEKTPRAHSGRFLVRMPSELHEQLAQAAESEHVSLNRYVTEALAASVASPQEREQPADLAPEPPASPSRPDARPKRALRMALVTNAVVVALSGLAAIVLLALALQHGA
jgi:RNA polymerase sigma-B factor